MDFPMKKSGMQAVDDAIKKGIDLVHAIGSDHTVNMRPCNVCYCFITVRDARRKQGD